MNKLKLFTFALLLVLVVGALGINLVGAQDDEDTSAPWMPGWGHMHGGMRGNRMMPFCGDFNEAGAWHPGWGAGMNGALMGVAAQTIGIDENALFEALSEGQTPAEIAEAHDVTAEALTEALIAASTTHMDEAVESGWMSASAAGAMREHMADMVTLFMSGEAFTGFNCPAWGGGMPGRGSGYHGHGRRP